MFRDYTCSAAQRRYLFPCYTTEKGYSSHYITVSRWHHEEPDSRLYQTLKNTLRIRIQVPVRGVSYGSTLPLSNTAAAEARPLRQPDMISFIAIEPHRCATSPAHRPWEEERDVTTFSDQEVRRSSLVTARTKLCNSIYDPLPPRPCQLRLIHAWESESPAAVHKWAVLMAESVVWQVENTSGFTSIVLSRSSFIEGDAYAFFFIF